MSFFDQFPVQAFNHLDLLANQVVEGFIIGMHKSPFHGFSVEFAEHRLYNQGESTKEIDWKMRSGFHFLIKIFIFILMQNLARVIINYCFLSWKKKCNKQVIIKQLLQ